MVDISQIITKVKPGFDPRRLIGLQESKAWRALDLEQKPIKYSCLITLVKKIYTPSLNLGSGIR